MEQGSPEWFEVRSRCLLTASNAGPFLIKNDQKSKKARERLILKFLSQDCYKYGDAWLLELREKESKSLDYNIAVQRGKAYEAEAIASFSDITGKEVEPVGLLTTNDHLFGASPDGLIGDDEGLECKVPIPETHKAYILEHLETGEMVDDYLFQVHFNLAVSERKLWHFYSHSVKHANTLRPWIQEPYLHIEVKRNNTTEDIIKGMDLMRAEYVAIRKKIAGQYKKKSIQ
jgi:hypothetical protein